MPRIRSARGARAAAPLGRGVLGVAAAALAGCVGAEATAPGPGPAPRGQIALAARVGPVAQAPGDAAAALRVSVAYYRAAGDSVPLGTQTLPLGAQASQQLPITVDLAACLRDAGRRGATLGSGTRAACVVRLDLALLAGPTVLDEAAVAPVVVRPGQTTTIAGAVALFTVARVAVAPTPGAGTTGALARLPVGVTLPLTASPFDAGGQPVTGRAARWTVSDPTVATVDSLTGVVTPRAPGEATVTASVGGRTGSAVVRVVPGPAPITVTGAGGAGAGAVTSQPPGINCQVGGDQAAGTCTFTFAGDSTVTLTATPNATSVFAGWGGACSGAAPVCAVTPSQALAVTASFARRQVTLTLGLSGAGGGTVAATGTGVIGAGTCTLAVGAGATNCTIPVQAGTSVTLTPTAAAASGFGGWAGACAAVTTGPCTLTIADSVSVGAVFTLLPVPITVAPAAGNAGAGRVASGDTTVNCAVAGAAASGDCVSTVPVGQSVTLRATPDTGQVFLGWGGACASAGATPSCTLVVRTTSAVTVAFGPPQTLTLTLGGTGGGRVAGAGAPCTLPGGSTGGVSCTRSVSYGDTVTLTATADSASTFAGWGGECSGTGACTLTLDRARAASATFTRRTVAVAVALSGSAGGSVLQNGSAVCTLAASGGSTSCPLTVPVFTTVSFTAAPAANAQFSGWSGPCSGTGGCQFTAGSNVAVGATFTPVLHAVTVTPNTQFTGSGSVTSSPSGVACNVNLQTPGTCAASFPAGTTVTLTATPASGSVLAGWGGACAAATGPTCTLPSLAAAAAVTVGFAPDQYTLTLEPRATGCCSGGALFSQIAGDTNSVAVCSYDADRPTATCVRPFPRGATVVVTASPDDGSVVQSWTGDCDRTSATTAVCRVSMTQNRTVGAVFAAVSVDRVR